MSRNCVASSPCSARATKILPWRGQLSAIGNRTFQVFPMLVAAIIWYLVLVSILLVGQYFLEKRFSRGYGRAAKAKMKLEGLAAEHGANPEVP